MADKKEYNSYAEVKARLDEIVAAVSDDDLPLDDALDLYEEAVSLGLRVSDMLEDDIDEEAAEAALEQEDGLPAHPKGSTTEVAASSENQPEAQAFNQPTYAETE